MSFIQESAIISVQGSMSQPVPISFPAEVVLPEYKALIPVRSLRRMNKMVRMGVWCGLSCGVSSEHPIVIGTGLGCLQDSVKFLDAIGPNEAGELPGVASPTPFIQSTHNAIAGQLALLTSNHGYNVTHVQDGHSFEAALTDALLMLSEGADSVVVGGADEKHDYLNTIAKAIGLESSKAARIAEGAAFFRLTSETGRVKVSSCRVYYDKSEIEGAISTTQPDIVLVGTSGVGPFTIPEFRVPMIDYSRYSGIYMSNAAFGMELGRRIITGEVTLDDLPPGEYSKVSLINVYNNRSFGLINLHKS